MSKRLTEIDKWKDSKFLELSIGAKAAWEFIRDNCDRAGFWEVNFRILAAHLSGSDSEVTPKEAQSYFKEASRFVTRINDSLVFLHNFIKHQYKDNLNPNNPAITGVLKILERRGFEYLGNGVLKPVSSPQGDPPLGSKEEEEVKEEVKDFKIPPGKIVPDRFKEFWEAYPRKPTDSLPYAKNAWYNAMQNSYDPDALILGAKNYAKYISDTPEFSKTPSEFLNAEIWRGFQVKQEPKKGRSLGKKDISPEIMEVIRAGRKRNAEKR